MIVPDYISPIIGYRTWQWDRLGLRSLNNERWVPGEALEAKCKPTSKPKRVAATLRHFWHDHNPPHERCTCGIYAAKNLQHLIDIRYIRDNEVRGEVYLWGKVWDHSLGYRAQYAYPKTFVLAYELVPRPDELECRLETLIAYRVEKIIMLACLQEMRIRPLAVAVPLWTKLFGFNGTGFKWLRLWNRLRSTEPSAHQCWTPGFYKLSPSR